MSSVNRKGIIFTGNQFGKSTSIFDKLIGDISTPEKILLDFENNFTSLKGSSIFSDYDLNSKSPENTTETKLNTFDLKDIPNYTLQGGTIIASKLVPVFSNTGSWHPKRFSPPSPEGWAIYDYNSFSNYVPKYDSSGNINSNYIIYNTLYEPGSGIARTIYDYPVRWNGDDYDRVPLFEYASWVSVANIGNTDINEVRLIMPKFKFEGSKNLNPKTNAPNDIMIYSHNFMISTSIDYPLYLSGTMGEESISDKLEPLAFEVYESDAFSDLTSRNRDFYTFNIKIPNNYSMNINDWLHMVFYWGSHDDYIDQLKLEYIKTDQTPFELAADQEDLNYYIWGKNSFFNKRINCGIGFSKSGINDQNIYFYNGNAKLKYFEQKYIEQKLPFRYKLNEIIHSSSIGFSNTTLNGKKLKNEEFLPIIIAIRKTGNFYDSPEINLELFFGESIPANYIPENWSDFNFYPEIPEDYDGIAKLIVSFNFENFNSALYTSASEYLNVDNSIVHIQMLSKNIFKEPIGDTILFNSFIYAFNSLIPTIRSKSYLDFFQATAKNILSRFVRMNLNKFITNDILNSNNIYDYLSFPNLYKFPSDSSIKVDQDTEPKAIQFDQDALNLINNFGTISTSKNFGGFNGTSLYINNIILDHDTDFEVYLERSYDEFYNHSNDDTHGLTRDYSFGIKFTKIDSNSYVKNLFLNASKFVLSPLEYQNRVDNKLSVDGYFIEGNYQSIPDYNLHFESAVIPDLKRETYKKIKNRQNSPQNKNRFTEAEFELSILSINPNTSKDELIQKKAAFGLTDSFYEIDTNKASDTYNSISELAMTVSNYNLNSNRYWLDNTSFLYGEKSIDNLKSAINLKDLRNDSFIITGFGYSDLDGTVNLLENISDQQIISSIGSTINQTQYNSTQRIIDKKIAIKIICDETQDIKGFKVKLNRSSPYLNKNAKIKCEIFSDKNNQPDYLLSIGSEISLSEINYQVNEYYFYVQYKFFKNKKYWIVLSTSQLPPLYEPEIKGLINVNGSGISGIYNPSNNTNTNFKLLNLNTEIGLGSTIGSEISNWYSISSIASSEFMIVSDTGSTSNKLNYSLRYNYGIGIKESSTLNAEKNLSTYSSLGWTSYEGTAFIEFYKPDVEVYAAFNKNYENSTLLLPPPNKYRETEKYIVDEYWSVNCKKFIEPQLLYIYPRSISFEKIEVLGSGINGSNIVSIASTNYTSKIISGLAVSENNFISAGTSISSISYDAQSDSYKLKLSSNNLSTFTNQIVGIGTSGSIYIKRANDIFVTLNYFVEGSLASTSITLEKSPTWKTYWYAKSKNKFNHLQKELKSDEITASYNLNFENKSVIGNTSYINGYAIGIFKPLSSVGYTIDFKFISSGGLKLFINDLTIPYIDKWTSTASTGFTCSFTLSELSEEIKLELHFNHFKTDSGTGQTINGYWKRQDDSYWKLIDDNFYIDNSVNPYLIDARKIQSLSSINIFKSIIDSEKPKFGSPLNDLIVLRSI